MCGVQRNNWHTGNVQRNPYNREYKFIEAVSSKGATLLVNKLGLLLVMLFLFLKTHLHIRKIKNRSKQVQRFENGDNVRGEQ